MWWEVEKSVDGDSDEQEVPKAKLFLIVRESSQSAVGRKDEESVRISCFLLLLLLVFYGERIFLRSENWYSTVIMATAILSRSTDLLLNLVVHGVSISGLNLWIDYARSIIVVAPSTVEFLGMVIRKSQTLQLGLLEATLILISCMLR